MSVPLTELPNPLNGLSYPSAQDVHKTTFLLLSPEANNWPDGCQPHTTTALLLVWREGVGTKWRHEVVDTV